MKSPVAHHIAQDHMSTLPSAPPGIRPVRDVFGGAAIKHDHGALSVLSLVIQNDQPFLALVDDSIVEYSAFSHHAMCMIENC